MAITSGNNPITTRPSPTMPSPSGSAALREQAWRTWATCTIISARSIRNIKKDYPAALHYLQKAIDYNLQHNNTRSLSFNYCYIAHVYDKMGDRQQSLVYALRTLAIAQQLRTPERLVTPTANSQRATSTWAGTTPHCTIILAITHSAIRSPTSIRPGRLPICRPNTRALRRNRRSKA
jgi:tetratricopeptide (TPR) repeat protein